MKVHLVVSGGVHGGKQIPIAGPQFLIGRDPHCQLRPASAAVSKQHCGIFQRDGKIFVLDYGSTNGTSVNGVPVVGEREIVNDDKLKVGPLEFVVRVESGPQSTVIGPQAKRPGPARPTASPTTIAPAAPATAAPAAPATAAPAAPVTAVADPDDAAAMLLAMDDGNPTPSGSGEVPDGATALDLPAVPGPTGAPGEAKPPAKPAAPANTSKQAADILSKYMRRPRQ